MLSRIPKGIESRKSQPADTRYSYSVESQKELKELSASRSRVLRGFGRIPKGIESREPRLGVPGAHPVESQKELKAETNVTAGAYVGVE